MLRVGIGKPKLHYVQGHNDMSHYFPSCWETTDYFFMSLTDYMEKREFDEFNMDPNLSKAELDLIGKKLEGKEELTLLDSPWTYRMSKLIEKAHGQTVWEFNSPNKDLTDYIRNVVVLGEDQLRLWSWYDAKIKFPILRIVCYILNKLNSFKARKEWKEWEKYVNEKA